MAAMAELQSVAKRIVTSFGRDRAYELALTPNFNQSTVGSAHCVIQSILIVQADDTANANNAVVFKTSYFILILSVVNNSISPDCPCWSST
jgi:hypothetical protein